MKGSKESFEGGQWITESAEETIALGICLGELIPPNALLCLYGELASGKTTLIKGIVQGALKLPLEDVNSPTFTYLNIYDAPTPIYHFDLYRLPDADTFLSLGFEEYFTAGGICCIEWSERIAPLLPNTAWRIDLQHLDSHKRKIVIDEHV